MSQTELERLQTRRIRLEEENRSLTEKQILLEGDIEILEEKVSINELVALHKGLEQTVLQLETRTNDLETKLNQ